MSGVISYPPTELSALEVGSPTGATPSFGDVDISGSFKINGVPITQGQTLNPTSLDGILFADQFPSLQATVNALPANGGWIIVPDRTLSFSSTVTVTAPNVKISGQSWASVLQRASSLAGNNQIIKATGSNFVLENLTIDGNLVSNTAADVDVEGVNSTVRFCQFINGAGTIQLALQGGNCRATGNTVIGTGGTANQTYGIWAQNSSDPAVMIDHNTILNTGLDGIGALGSGTQIISNYVSGCQTYTGNGGGQIVAYVNSGTLNGMLIANNVIQQGGSAASGIEISGQNVSVTGNQIFNQYGYGIGLDSGAADIIISGNLILNTGVANSGTFDGISVPANLSNIVIAGNRVGDNQSSATMRYPITINSGTSNSYAITGNVLGPSATGGTGVQLNDHGSGLNKAIGANVGLSDQLTNVASATTLTLPNQLGQTIKLFGSITIGTIVGGYDGQILQVLNQNGTVVANSGATIANTITMSPSLSYTWTYDGTKWWIK